MNRPFVRRLAVLAGAGGALLSGNACEKKVDAQLAIVLPSSVAGATRWVEVGVVPGMCPSSAQIAAGVPASGTVARVAFRPEDPNAPAVGSLTPGKYGFVGVARGDDCGILATTCTPVDLQGGTVTLRLEATDPTKALAATACTMDTVCQDARCVPRADFDSPAVGADCSLEALGAGPLPNPFTTAEEVVSAPAVVATENGFLIAYREYSAAYGSARLTIVPVDFAGGIHPAITRDLEGRCITSEEADGAGLAYAAGSGGMVALARAPCGTTPPALDLFEVDANGAILRSTSSPVAGAGELTLSSAKAAASGATPGTFLVAANKDGAATLYTISDLAIKGTVPFGGTAPVLASTIVTTANVRALLASGRGAAPDNTPPVEDAGVDGGDDAGAPAGGGDTREVDLQRLQVATSEDLGSLPAPTEFEATWASVAADGRRAVVLSEGSTLGRAAVLRLFYDGKAAGRPVGYSTPTPATVLFADTALKGDHLFAFAEQRGALTLVAFDQVASTPTLKREVSLGLDPRLASIGQVQGGLVAVAATESRVLVSWMTARRFVTGPAKEGEASFKQTRLGGYAVYACR